MHEMLPILGFFTPNDVKSMMNEVLKMQFFDHPNVMSLIGVCVDGGAGPSIIMPYMANGSLLSFLKKERENMIMDEDKDPDTVCLVCSTYFVRIVCAGVIRDTLWWEKRSLYRLHDVVGG